MAEGQTATNPQTGERVVMRGGQWVPMGSTSRPAVQAIPGRVKQPDALDMSRDIRDQTRLIIAETGEAREGRREVRDIDRTQFDQTSKLRDDFENQPAVKRYRASLDTYVTGLKSSPTPEGDRALITAFAKLSDPTTGVLQGEAASVEQSSPAVERIIANLNNQLDASGGFSPRARESLRQEMASLMAERNKAFIDERVRFKGIADRSGIDILDVVGEHPGARFQQDEANAIGRPVTQLDYQGQAATGQVDPNTPSPPDLGGGGDQPLSVDVTDDSPATPEELASFNARKAGRDTIFGALDAGVRGAADVVTLGFADELAALLSTPFNDQTYAQNLQDQRQTDQADEAVNPWARLGGQVGGALMLPSGIGRAAATGGVRSGAVRAGQEGAAFGGAYGFGSGEDMGSRGTNALLGAATGGAVGYGAGRALPAAANALGGVTQGTRNALAQFMPQRAAETARRQGLAADAASQGVDLMPADVGGAMVKRFTAGAAQAPASAERVRQASMRTNDQIGEAVGRQAQATGKPLAADEAGEITRKGAEVFTAQTRARASRLYDKAQQASKGVRIEPKGAVQAIDEEIARLSEAEAVNRPLIGELKKFRESLAQSGGISVSGLRDVRSTAGKAAYTEALRATPAQATFARIQDAIAKDVEAGLTAVGRPDALRLFQTADRLWKERIQAIDEVLEPVLGKAKSGEQVLSAIEGMAQGKGGGVNRLSRLMAALPKDEAANVTATIIERLGKSTPGAQNAAGDAFSAASFLTNWNKMSGKGKAILFRDQELRANLDAIARLSGAVKDTQRFANTSNTAGATIAQPTIGGFIALIPQNLMGRLLTSKGFTGWLARTPKFQNAGAQKAYVTRLEKIAAREPVHSAEIIQLKDYLANRIAQSPQQAAADVGGDQDDGRKKPPEQQR